MSFQVTKMQILSMPNNLSHTNMRSSRNVTTDKSKNTVPSFLATKVHFPSLLFPLRGSCFL